MGGQNAIAETQGLTRVPCVEVAEDGEWAKGQKWRLSQ